MAKQQTDDELNLRRKARRRLIGAVALTLAVVVILPMVLDNEPKSTGNNIDLSIPDPDKAGAFVPSVAIPDAKPPSTSSAALTGSTPAASGPDKDKPSADQSQTGKASVKGYVAQIGAYANADTAKREYNKLKKWGFNKAYTEKVGGNTRVRVGPYTDRDKAEKVGHLLEKHGYHPAIVSTK